MSAAQELIAKVVREHRLVFFAFPPNRRCNCGWISREPYATWTDHPEHLAEAIDQAFNGLDPDQFGFEVDDNGTRRTFSWVSGRCEVEP